MIFRISILVVASVAATFTVSPVNTKRFKKQNSLLSVSAAKDFSSSQRIDMEEETEEGNCERVENSQNSIKELEKRRVTLEGKLLELYSQKQKLSYISCLQRNLDEKTADTDKLNLRIHALKAEIKGLQEIIRQGNLAKKQLEMEKKMVREMQMKNGNASQIKGQIVVLEEQLSGFRADESSAREAMVKKKIGAVKSIELEAVKMKRRNKELELERRELSVKLFAAYDKISALANMTQSKTIAKISELRHTNGEVSKEVERLQKSRFDMVEELVYQRWLNACLRAEIRDHQNSSRKLLQKGIHKTSDHKPCKVTSQDPDMSSSWSSFTSSTESEDMDSSISKDSGTHHSTSWSSSMDGSSVALSPDKFFIGSPLERIGVTCTDSTSIVPSKTLVLNTELHGISEKIKGPVQPDFSETVEVPNLTKVRRVSFNDAVETVPPANQVLIKFAEGVFDDKDIVTLVTGNNRSGTKAGLPSQSPLAGEKHEFSSSEVFLGKPIQSSDSNRRSHDKDGLHSSISNVVPNPNENKMDTDIIPTVFAFLILLFAVLVCFLHVSARIY
ncbi:putative actin binding protein [Corchorus capsularis]|uniref:Putative actin binding protein n=1 Tax=Corchorus capsularis TaxID=210143 RepID=A0A1R3JMI9_COCAP|nr:putative actin binding protein [Corchorus capsularis]